MRSNPERAALLDRIHQLEREAGPLEPGAADRRRLRDAVVGSSERFLEEVDTLKAYEETEDKGIGLLGAPISEHGIPRRHRHHRRARALLVPRRRGARRLLPADQARPEPDERD